MPMLIDPYRFSTVTPPAIAYGGSGVNTTANSSYSIASVGIGTAASDRYVVAAISGLTTAGTRTISSCTIGGISATLVGRVNISASCALELWIAAVPTGTTATVAPTWSGSMENCGVACWALTGLTSSTAVSTATDTTKTSNQEDVNLTTVTGDVIVAANFISNTTANRTTTWVGVTEDYDGVIETLFSTHSGGSFTAVSSESPRTINDTSNSGTLNTISISANWR